MEQQKLLPSLSPCKSRRLAKIEVSHGLAAALACSDRIASMHVINDTIKDVWNGYVDPAGNKSSSPNSYMTLRKKCNQVFGIKTVRELDGDIEGSLIYALANYRASRNIRQGIAEGKLRDEIRPTVYTEFEKVKSI